MNSDSTMQSNGDLQIRVEAAADGRTVVLQGEVSMITGGMLRMALLDCLQAGASTKLDAAGITAIDLSGLQLLCSAHRTYVSRQAKFQFGGISETVRENARAAGYDTCRSVCPYRREGNCLWKW